MQLHTTRRAAAGGWVHTLRSWMPAAVTGDWRSRLLPSSAAGAHKRRALLAASVALLMMLLFSLIFLSSRSSTPRFPSVTPRRPWIVHLVPHSHLDAGWLHSFDEYYTAAGAPIISSVLQGLARKVERRFTWADMSFLLRWMDEQADQAVPWLAGKTSEQCRGIVNPAIARCLCANPIADASHVLSPSNLLLLGCLVLHPPNQLAVLGGSYVAMDEAMVSPLEAMEGFRLGRERWARWVEKMKEAMISVMGEADLASALKHPPRGMQLGWNIDQFGHGASTPLILRGVGIKALVAARTLVPEHERMKRERAREFLWGHTQASIISAPHSLKMAKLSSDDPSRWGDPAASVSPPPLLTSILAEHYSSPPCLKFLQTRSFDLSSPQAACTSSEDASKSRGHWVPPGVVETLEGLFSYLHGRIPQQQSRHILVLVGDDFRFRNEGEVQALYENLAWIRRGVNQQQHPSSTNAQGPGALDFDDDDPSNNLQALVGPEGWDRIQSARAGVPMHVRVSHGVDYVEAIRGEGEQYWTSKERGTGPGMFPMYPLAPVLSTAGSDTSHGAVRPPRTNAQTDLFPYSDLWFDNEWSGYYGNVPFLKSYVKRMMARVRAVKNLEATAFLTRGLHLTLPPAEMEHAERQLQLLLHHDAITGTHRADVHADYMRQAYEAEQSLHAMLQVFAAELQSADSQVTATTTDPIMQLSSARFNSSAYDDHRITLPGGAGADPAVAASPVVDITERKAIVDVTSLLAHDEDAAAVVQRAHISVQLFNPLAESVVQSLELRIEVACDAWIRYAQVIGAAFPALRVWDPQTNRMLRTQATMLDSSQETLLAQCVSSGSTSSSPSIASFDLHVETRFASLEIKTLHILCVSGTKAQRQAEIESTARTQADLVRWTEGSGVWLRGARFHALVHFDSDDQQLSYTLIRQHMGTDEGRSAVSEALNFHHTHGYYLSSTRVPANSGAYLFRSLFPSAFLLALLPLAAGWGCAIAAWACVWILALVLARRAPWIRVLAKRVSRVRIDWCERGSAATTASRSPLPGLHSGGKKRGGALQTAADVIGILGRLFRHLLGRVASNPVLLHASLGLKLGSVVVLALVGASSHVSEDLVRFVLSPESDASLFRGGLCAGGVQGALLALSVVVQARREAEQERQRKKAREDEVGEERGSSLAAPDAAAPTSTWRTLSLPLAVLAFAVSFFSMCCFLFMAFPSMQARLFLPAAHSPDGSAHRSERAMFPRYALTAQGPLFSEISYQLSPDVWQSIRVYNLEEGAFAAASDEPDQNDASSQQPPQAHAWQNEVVECSWSVAPCRDCQLIARIRHTPVSAPSQPPRPVAREPDLPPDSTHAPPENMRSIPGQRAMLPFGRWIRRAAHAVRDLLRGLRSLEFHRFFTDDGLSLVHRTSQGFSPFLASKIFPLNGVGSVLESESSEPNTEGFSVVAGNQGFGVSRLAGALELLHQRWLTLDDEKGLDAGIEDSRRYRLRVHLQPKWRQEQEQPLEATRKHVLKARTIQRRVAQRPFVFGVSAPQPAGATISSSDPSLESPSRQNFDDVSLLSMHVHTGSSSLPSPPPMLPPQPASSSCRTGDARLLALRVLSHGSSSPLRWSRDQLCSWLNSRVPMASDTVEWRLSCVWWTAVSLSFERIAPEDGAGASDDDLVMHSEQPAALLVWVQRTTCAVV